MNDTYRALIDGMKKYGSTEADIVRHALSGVEREAIREDVILAPSWEPERLGLAGERRNGERAYVRVWDVSLGEKTVSYIVTGIGAPVMMDVALALGLTACRRAVFIGSVGALDARIEIGDLMIPDEAVCFTGANAFLTAGSVAENAGFGRVLRPDADLKAALWRAAEAHGDVRCHPARVASIDTIVAQFGHIDELTARGCDCVEMETAAAFEAASIAGFSLAALYSVSDNTVKNRSLLSGRGEEEMARRRRVRREVFPAILQVSFS